MKKPTTTAVGLNGCGIARVRLAAAEALIAAMRGDATASAVCRQTPPPSPPPSPTQNAAAFCVGTLPRGKGGMAAPPPPQVAGESAAREVAA